MDSDKNYLIDVDPGDEDDEELPPSLGVREPIHPRNPDLSSGATLDIPEPTSPELELVRATW